MAHDDDIEHISGPALDDDGFVVGEIALPGGLPPEDEQDDGARFTAARWDEALTVADRDGFVLYDPDTPGGFRALTPAEREELTDSVRTGTSTELAGGRASEPEAAGSQIGRAEVAGPGLTAGGGGQADPRVSAEEGPWVDRAEGIAARERWAVENADPANALDDTHPDDLDRLQQRLDDLRLQLSSYTWRDGVDRDQALAERREQLGRWHDDDTDADQNNSATDTQPDDDGHAERPQCLIYPGDPRWHQ